MIRRRTCRGRHTAFFHLPYLARRRWCDQVGSSSRSPAPRRRGDSRRQVGGDSCSRDQRQGRIKADGKTYNAEVIAYETVYNSAEAQARRLG